jgi:hypothetical protein
MKKSYHFKLYLFLNLLLLCNTISTVHPAQETKRHHSKTPLSLYCYHCQKTFKTQSELSSHTLSVLSRLPLPLSCLCCNNNRKKKSTRLSAIKHFQRHYCPQCAAYSSDASNTTRHQRIHSGDRPFCCSFCSLTFVNSSNKNKHQRICLHNPKFVRIPPTVAPVPQTLVTQAPEEDHEDVPSSSPNLLASLAAYCSSHLLSAEIITKPNEETSSPLSYPPLSLEAKQPFSPFIVKKDATALDHSA